MEEQGWGEAGEQGGQPAVNAAGSGNQVRTEESLFYICYGNQMSVYQRQDCILTAL